jgi:ankyrin repeat protein
VNEKGANVNSQDWYGVSPLTMAAVVENIELVKVLLDNGADINIKNDKGHTPLSYAASLGHVESVKILLNKGADVNADNQILHHMIEKLFDPTLQLTKKQIEDNFAPIIKILIEHGIKLTPIINLFLEQGIKFNVEQQNELQTIITQSAIGAEPKGDLEDTTFRTDHTMPSVLVEEFEIAVH